MEMKKRKQKMVVGMRTIVVVRKRMRVMVVAVRTMSGGQTTVHV